ncbi:hypothetical protein [Sulfurospirillum arcachonense]|uniref:hypothetical protein n=1 Tax=Sulfurospirillum arcachonense TaxID=57666 RepID=UPI000469E52F|nr:hypothetical protein [Sulfurospirillum arcachonense]
MNVNSIVSSQSISQVKNTEQVRESKNKEELSSSFNIDNHQLESLDERGNEILNQLLVGKTDREKSDIKVILDGMLMFEAHLDSSGNPVFTVNKDTSEESILAKLDKKMQEQKANTGNQEILRIMEQLKELYEVGYSPLDQKV